MERGKFILNEHKHKSKRRKTSRKQNGEENFTVLLIYGMGERERKEKIEKCEKGAQLIPKLTFVTQGEFNSFPFLKFLEKFTLRNSHA